MKPSPALIAARKIAKGIKGLTVKPLVSGLLLWYWEPNRAERAGGWLPLKFHHDRAAAIAGSDARNAEIVAWRAGHLTPDQAQIGGAHIPSIAPPPKSRAYETIAEASQRYQRDYLSHCSGNHQRNARSQLGIICRTFGDLLPSDIEERHLAAWTDAMRGRGDYTAHGRQVSDTTAHNRLRTFRALRNWIKNPHAKFAQPKGRAAIWEADDEAAFIAAAYDLNLPSMAFAMKLAIYTGQRSADLRGFTEAQLQPVNHLIDPATKAALADAHGKIWGWQFIQAKTQTALTIPFEPDMLAEINRIIASNRAKDRPAGRLLTYLVVNDRSGERLRERHFIRLWNEVKDHAIKATGRSHMDGLHWHDLRRTRCVRLKRQGFSHDRIATLTGHTADTVNEMMKTYAPVDDNMTASLIVESSQRERRG